MIQKVKAPFADIYKNREFIKELARRDIVDRYKGQPLGAIWAFIHPAVLIFIYIFLFGIVFRNNIGFSKTMPLSYTSYILSGVIPWLFIQNCLTTGAVSVIGNTSVIKQVMLPPIIFPAKAVVSALIVEAIYLVITLVYNITSGLITGSGIHLTYLLLPVALIMQIILMLGFSLMFGAVTAYFRDLKDIIQVLCTLGIYLAPILYLPDAVPEMFRFLVYINPFSYVIWVFQDVLYYGQILHGFAWIVTAVMSLVVFYGGHAVFNKLKTAFGSVL